MDHGWRADGLLEVWRGQVEQAWIDYNGHMNVVWYRLAFDKGCDGLYEQLGFAPADYNERLGLGLMVVEDHTRYHAELLAGEGFRVLAQLLGFTAKTVHYFQYLENLSRPGLAATHEQLALNVDLAERRAVPLPGEHQAALQARLDAQAAAGLTAPRDAGRTVGAPRR
jgi:acyl-CoA thioester hydrolase